MRSTDPARWSSSSGCVARFVRAADRQPIVFGTCTSPCASASWALTGTLISGDAPLAPDGKAMRDIVATALHDPEGASRCVWGAYFLVVHDRNRQRFLVLADPCGQHPVYYRQASDGTLHVGDRIEDFHAHGGHRLAPDPSFLDDYLAHGYGDREQTGVTGIRLLQAGDALCWSRGRSPATRRVWAPWPASPTASAQARRPLLDTLTATLRAQLCGRASVVLELSGGIDSTALAVALRMADLHDNALAVTHFDPARIASDEVAIAQRVARRCAIAHVCRPLRPCLPFSPLAVAPTVARPATKLCFLALHDALLREHLGTSNSVLLNGNGGDSLYLSAPPAGIVFDLCTTLRFAEAGARVRDLAILYRTPVWAVLRRALDDALRFASEPVPAAPTALRLPRHKRRRPRGLFDELLRDPRLLGRPGRRRHIAALGAIIDESLTQPWPVDRRPLMPFLCQPVIDHAMATPLETTFNSEYTRLNVRQAAFEASALPNLWRRDKGDVMHAALLGMRVHRAHVRETCLDGWSASQGLVNRDALDALIHRLSLGYADGLVEVARVYATERFVSGLDA